MSTWKWKYDWQEHGVLPKCLIGCRDDPPPDNPPNVTLTWRFEKHWESKTDLQKPVYKCSEGKH